MVLVRTRQVRACVYCVVCGTSIHTQCTWVDWLHGGSPSSAVGIHVLSMGDAAGAVG